MNLKLMYITNNVDIAKVAEDSGVDRIFIDLEIYGKINRQGHLDTVISNHTIDDVKKIRSVLKKSKLLVRVNPIHEGSKKEIDTIIEFGADIIMLPYFKRKREVETFVKFVNKRAKVSLLCETPEAVFIIDDILEVDGIDEIHIGLNDLHLGYKMKFMFELLVDGTVEMLCKKFRDKGIFYGFGGIARLGHGMLPAEYIIGEHHRLGSGMVILSRSFCNVKNTSDLDSIRETFDIGVKEIRNREEQIKVYTEEKFKENLEKVKIIVDDHLRHLHK